MSTGSILTAIDLALALLMRAQQIQTLVAQAQAEGRDNLKPEEWSAIHEEDQRERRRLAEAIAKAKGEGR